VNILSFISLLILCQEVAKMVKTAKNGPQLTPLIAPTILELKKSLFNKIYCSNIKLKMLFYKIFFSF